MDETVEDRPALPGMRHLRVELHAVETARFVGHRGDRGRVVARDDLEARRQRRDLVAVAHPHVEQAVLFAVDAVLNAFEELGVAARAHFGVAELAHLGVFDAAAQWSRHRLHAVADAENGDPELEYGLGRLGRGVFVDRSRTAGENHPARGEVANEAVADVEGVQLAIDFGFPDPARDQLRVLRAEIEDEDLVVHDARVSPRSGSWGLP